MSAVRVLLVLYDEPARQALRSMLTEAPDIDVAGEAASVVEALLQADDASPDVVLVDAEVHGVSGVEMIRLLKDSGYDWPVVALGANLDPLEEALSAGALGFATKDCPDEEMVDIIRRVSEGEFAFGPGVMETPRGMRIALHYMTGQAEIDVRPTPGPPPVDEARSASQDVAGPPPGEPSLDDAVEVVSASPPIDARESAVEADLDSAFADAEEDAIAAFLDSIPALVGEAAFEAVPDSAPVDAEEAAVAAVPKSTLADAGATAASSVELVISSPAKMDSVVKLYQWLHDLPEAEVTGVVRSGTGDTVVTAKIIHPIPMAEMLLALNVVSEVSSEPSPEGSGASTRLRLVLNGG
jgi:CheY-like chemotaxis protein